MKAKIIYALKVLAVSVACAAVLFGVGYGYLQYSLTPNETEAEAKDFSVPYTAVEANQGVLFSFPDGSGVLIYLDFSIPRTTAVIMDECDPNRGAYSGYPANFTVAADYPLIGGIIDRVGGVELDIDGERLRYTGVQVQELLSVGCSGELREAIVTQVVEKISQDGFATDDFVYIIENSDTDLTVPDCYTWAQQMKEMCARANIIHIE